MPEGQDDCPASCIQIDVHTFNRIKYIKRDKETTPLPVKKKNTEKNTEKKLSSSYIFLITTRYEYLNTFVYI